MNHLETYLDRIIDQKSRSAPDVRPTPALPLSTPVEATSVTVEPEEGTADEQGLDILGALKRRWHVVFLVFVLLAPVAVRAVWYFVQPGHIVAAQLKVAPAVVDIMTGNEESGSIGNYREFVATQAVTITSTPVLRRVAAELAPEAEGTALEEDEGLGRLAFFQDGPRDVKRKFAELLDIPTPELEPVATLRRAVISGVISAVPRRNTHFIDVTMKSMHPEDAIQIVDRLIREYESSYTYGAGQEGVENLTRLRHEHAVVSDRISKAKREIRTKAEESGATEMGTEGELLAGRITTIHARSIQLEAKRIALETEVAIIENSLAVPVDSNLPMPETHTRERLSYVDSDIFVSNLTRQVMMMEEQLLVAREQLAWINPVLREKEKRLKTLQARLETARDACGREYDDFAVAQAELQDERLRQSRAEVIMTQLEQTRTELIQTKEEEKRFKDLLDAEQLKLAVQGNASLQIKDMQFDIDLDMEIFNRLSRRIKKLEMEQSQKPRISIVEYANRVRYEDRRIPYSASMTMGIFGLGCLLALLVDKADKRLKEPQEVAALTNLPLIGTVANARTVKAAKFAAQISSDYQTIRTNLTLLGTGGMPKLLCVTSPGPREGKSSFSMNLATSLSKSGERVLLVDGDLRKPDTLRQMRSAHMTEHVSHVPIEGGSEYSIWSVSATGLDILVPNAGNRGDVFELIASPAMAQRIMNLSQKYDHIIIDTPPLLAFPDALIWARIAGVAIMIGFAQKTTIGDLMEAKDRLSQTNAQLLGTVLNNVKMSHGYQRYHYGYYDRKGGRRDFRMIKKLVMPTREAQETKTSKRAKEETA